MYKKPTYEELEFRLKVFTQMSQGRVMTVDTLKESNAAYTRGYQARTEVHNAEIELKDLIDALSEITQSTTEVIIYGSATATWEALRAYLATRKSYDTIVGGLKRLNDAIDRQNSSGIFLVTPDNLTLTTLTALIDDLTRHINEFENGLIEGEILRDFVASRTAHNAAYNLFMGMRQAINLGGAPSKGWRMIVGQRVSEIKAESGLTDKGALAKLESEIKFMDDPSEEWLYIQGDCQQYGRRPEAMRWRSALLLCRDIHFGGLLVY